MMESASNQHRIGIAILKVLAVHALKRIPVVGPFVEVTVDVYKAARTEIDKGQPHALTEQEVTAALQSISYAEAREAVDSVLSSPEGRKAVANLNPIAKEKVRRSLINIPSELDQIISTIEASDKLEAELQQQAQQERFNEIEKSYKVQMRERRFESAYALVKEMLKIDPRHQEALRAEAWLQRRLERRPIDYARLIWTGYKGGVVCFFFFALFGLGGVSNWESALGVLLILPLTLGGFVGVFMALLIVLIRWLSNEL